MTMLSINTNVGALQAAQASYSVNKSMETSMERLSTGKRVNSSADDAAGLQIVQRMTAEIMGLRQAARNAADGQAMLATAEGAAKEIGVMLLRLREIAVQAANGTAEDAGDRAGLAAEFLALENDYPIASHSDTVPSQFSDLLVSPGCSTGVFCARGGRRGSWGHLGAQS